MTVIFYNKIPYLCNCLRRFATMHKMSAIYFQCLSVYIGLFFNIFLYDLQCGRRSQGVYIILRCLRRSLGFVVIAFIVLPPALVYYYNSKHPVVVIRPPLARTLFLEAQKFEVDFSIDVGACCFTNVIFNTAQREISHRYTVYWDKLCLSCFVGR